jgi:hypothetical protein
MHDRILVRGELSVWVHVWRVVAVACAVVGVVLGVIFAKWGWAVAAGGAVIWLILESVAWQARRKQTWLTLHPDGIEIEDRSGRRAIHDSQVAAAALEIKKNLANGELSSITRKFTIWTENWPEPILMENRLKIGKGDPLAGLIDRLLERLQTNMEQTIARGGTASGDGWHLSRSALTIGRSPNEEQMPLSEVAAIESRDGQMCVWRRGVDLPVAKLPLSGRNVYLLPALVQPYRAEQSEPGAGTGASSGLGRVLFERRAGTGTILALAIAGIALIAFGAAMLVVYERKQADEGALVGGLFMLAGGIFLAGLAYWLGFSGFRCHEFGVWRKTPLGERSLRYADVGRFQYSAVRHYHNGAYVGTQLTMRFTPLPEIGTKPMKYTARTKGDDDDLDALRDSVSNLIAARMAEKFQAGQTVSWTTNLEFTPDGIRYRPQKWFQRQPPVVLPYGEYAGYELKGAVFSLLARGQKKAVLTEQAAAENFYPGFFLLQMLLHREATPP